MLYNTDWQTKTEATTEELPTFDPKWWYSTTRLDARPVAWSLRNRPDDWVWRTEGITILHKPSRHVFWVAIGGPSLWEADCSCSTTSRKFQLFQKWTFRAALWHWRRNNGLYDPQEFAAHFMVQRSPQGTETP